MKAVVFAYHDMGCQGVQALLDAGYDIAAIFTHADNPHLAAIIWTYDTPFFLYAPGSPRYSKMVDTWRGGKYWLRFW